ncbi:uncharacterized protein METZ01_LOCUS64749 [marine metagenome]|uniref:Uncharacterized protein n=1 Tax=marine metagenome TaxID=408172 RepID=A0A381T6U4_9ZZZZ
MISELIYSLIASSVLTFLYYIDSNLTEDDNDLTKYLKYFGLNCIVFFITINIYSLGNNSSMDNYTVNVGLPNF